MEVCRGRAGDVAGLVDIVKVRDGCGCGGEKGKGGKMGEVKRREERERSGQRKVRRYRRERERERKQKAEIEQMKMKRRKKRRIAAGVSRVCHFSPFCEFAAGECRQTPMAKFTGMRRERMEWRV